MSKPMVAARVDVVRSLSSGTFLRSELRRVLLHPHPVLEQRAVEVDPCDPSVVALAKALTTTMRASPACVGLAAPGIRRRPPESSA